MHLIYASLPRTSSFGDAQGLAETRFTPEECSGFNRRSVSIIQATLTHGVPDQTLIGYGIRRGGFRASASRFC